MATEWEFLEPWHAALSRTLLQSNKANSAGSAVDVLLMGSPRNRDRASTQRFLLRVLIDKSKYQDASLLRQLREGIELFTLLAIVNNGAFVQLMMKSTGIKEAVPDDRLYYPFWDLRLVGTLSPNHPAATHTSVTWAALLGCPDDPPEYSPEFRAAANKLEAMNVKNLCFWCSIYWKCYFQDNRVEGRQELDDFHNDTSSVPHAFQKLLGLRVPAIAQLSITREKAILVDMWRQTQVANAPDAPKCGVVKTKISSLAASSGFLEVTEALVRVPMLMLMINLDCKDWIADPLHDVINAGIILRTLVCSRSLCRLTKYCNTSATSTRAECGELHLECDSVPANVFAATCSAVADVNPATQLKGVFMKSMNPDRWSWLVYGLYCRSSNDGDSENPIPRLRIRETILTNADISRGSYHRPI